ncbi:MAG TPA: ribosome maturation factor RimM [Dokdonella sp.]|uniref:ribosome maturation factor RimM n=1 Tax=Dokdonella sp. TaxID=2291710 RepID=UPI002D7EC7FB|nr:ribosome maturation factor RimM [Dokdonella sp.]HET9033532.1 ribosome maturation factor RimM [Dokdonella sp.]
MTTAGDRLILVGRIVGLHGVAGEVKLESYTDPRMQIFRYQPWLLNTPAGNREISGCRGREQGKGMVASLPDVADRDLAASLVGCEIKVRRSALPQARPDEYYWTDLEGLEVVTIEGVALGRISHLLATGANDVMVVRDGERERLLPFVLDEYVKAVDFEEGRVTVDWDPEF